MPCSMIVTNVSKEFTGSVFRVLDTGVEGFSEMLVIQYLTTRRHIPEDVNVYILCIWSVMFHLQISFHSATDWWRVAEASFWKHCDRAAWRSGDALDSYSGYARFETRDTAYPHRGLSWFTSVLPGKCRVWGMVASFQILSNSSLIWRLSSSGIWRRVVCWVTTDVSEEHIASIFRVKEILSARTSKQAGGDMFLQNVGCNSTDYTASYPRRW
jgi:hypothetical protein